jgi:hypothetical protein
VVLFLWEIYLIQPISLVQILDLKRQIMNLWVHFHTLTNMVVQIIGQCFILCHLLTVMWFHHVLLFSLLLAIELYALLTDPVWSELCRLLPEKLYLHVKDFYLITLVAATEFFDSSFSAIKYFDFLPSPKMMF